MASFHIDPVVIDGAAIGFLVWAILMLYYIFISEQGLNGKTFLGSCLVFVGSGICIGWLWP